MKITEHFNREEFDCSDGTLYPENKIESTLRPLCKALEKIREINNGGIFILSGYRTLSYNKLIKGAVKSRHMIGDAADLVMLKMNPLQLYKAIKILIDEFEIPQGGLGLYDWGVHYDQRGYKARWNFSRRYHV